MSTLAKLSFGWGTKFTPEQQLLLHKLCFAPEFIPDSAEKEIYSNVIMLVEDAAQFGEFSVKEILPERMTKRLSTSLIGDFEQRNTTIVNEKCHVAVGGLGLLVIDTVKHEIDYCTNALAEDLRNGWRIIAICVQPDQRRPDYILGKSTNPE